MRFSKEDLKKAIDSIEYVSELNDLKFEDDAVDFNICFNVEGIEKEITFKVSICSHYPLKVSGSETIYFRNIELIEYSHVMSDGSVCFHNHHCIDFNKKLRQDFDAIKNWITKYIVNQESDSHYEHLIYTPENFNGEFYSYQFTEVEHDFSKDEYGTVHLNYLNKRPYDKSTINNFLVQSFFYSKSTVTKYCNWSSHYSNKEVETTEGVYLFIENSPAINKRFSFDNWQEFSKSINQEFLSYLSQHIIAIRSSHPSHKPLPLFIGFNIRNSTIHWQVALLNIDEPIFHIKRDASGKPTYSLQDKKINWALTNNSSYPYFFGRGAFNETLTNSKILIIGVGAIGSNVAKTLVRCGCKNILLVDYDIKKPENVCRSEYEFQFAYTNKVEELAQILTSISPFVEIKISKTLFTESLKSETYSKQFKDTIEKELSAYDYIFDCSTDDDLMYVLDGLAITASTINLSITNRAKSLVCGVSPNTYNFVRHQFEKILVNDVDDLYNPLGCWNPTFKASYNDVSTLVQFALKHINIMVAEKQLDSFVIDYIDNDETLQVRKF